MVPLWVYELHWPWWLRLWLGASGVALVAAGVASVGVGHPLALVGVWASTGSLAAGIVVGRWRPVAAWHEVQRTERVYHLRRLDAASAQWIPARPLMERTGLWMLVYGVVLFLLPRHAVSGSLLLALVAMQLVLRWGYPRRRRPDAFLAWRDPDGRQHRGYVIHGWGPPVDAHLSS
ncbi:MAG: hypothetical protein OWU33_03670 [Firmicutes bacterium]|nr:hypothetical protein [Bacillota bacterium]